MRRPILKVLEPSLKAHLSRLGGIIAAYKRVRLIT